MGGGGRGEGTYRYIYYLYYYLHLHNLFYTDLHNPRDEHTYGKKNESVQEREKKNESVQERERYKDLSKIKMYASSENREWYVTSR